jgi:arsenate reductase (glutaredoxin)
MVELPRTDAEIVLLHNPRCSKSRAAKELLEARGVRFAERRYLDAPLSLDELRDLAARLGRPPSEWVRAGEPAYAAAGLGAGSDADAILRAMASHPALLERPVLVRGRRAVVGRPPERIAALLE